MKTVLRVERHVIKDRRFDNICHLSKNLYNYVNYLIRQDYFNKIKMKSAYQIISQLTNKHQSDYVALPAQTSQQIIMILLKNWKSFFKAQKAYSKDPSKFLGKPKIPNYKDKDGTNIVIFTNQQCKLLDNYTIRFPSQTNLSPLKTNVPSFNQVRIIPKATCFIVEVVYEKEIPDIRNSNNFLAIDVGVNNLATCVNNVGINPFIINGRIVKSINQYYNKQKAILQSYVANKTSNRLKALALKRNNKIQNFFHHCSSYIVNFCNDNNISKIIIGHNDEWKQEINNGKKNNQNFVNIPFNMLIEQIKYKGEENGISVVITEESYTSKVDHLAYETLEHHDQYLGKRVKRGFFKSSTNKFLNADINGAIGIARKELGDSCISMIINRGLAFNPVKVKFNKVF